MCHNPRKGLHNKATEEPRTSNPDANLRRLLTIHPKKHSHDSVTLYLGDTSGRERPDLCPPDELSPDDAAYTSLPLLDTFYS